MKMSASDSSMLRKLRRKFVAVVLGVAAFILLAVFLVLLFTTKAGLENQSKQMLTIELEKEEYQKGPALPKDSSKDLPWKGGLARRERSPGVQDGRFLLFSALLDEEGNVTLPDRGAFLLEELEEETLEELVRYAAEGKDFGVIPGYHLRYAKKQTEQGIKVAFGDISAENAAVVQLIRNSLIVGFFALLVLFGASLLLARWAVRPVERAWIRQKQFVGDASHELKTPLTVILSNADMLLTQPAQGQRRWAENIKAEAWRMKSLTEELLSLAKLENGGAGLVFQKVDLSYLVTDSILLFEAAAFENGKTFSYEVEEGIFVAGDPAALSQLAGIFLDNALKYGREHSEIAVRLTASEKGRYALFSVTSQGDAIPKEELPRIFQRFYRRDPSREETEGYGLGLAIAREIVESHKGSIWAESANGTNIFSVLLPRMKGPKASKVGKKPF